MDEVLLKPLDRFRHHKYTQGLEEPWLMGSQVILAEKNATFLRLWQKSYYNDYQTSWTYNALQVPFHLSKKYPDLIHVAGYSFLRPNYHELHQLFRENYDWSENYGMHLFIRHYKEKFDLTVVKTLNTTMGSIGRHIFFGNKSLCT